MDIGQHTLKINTLSMLTQHLVTLMVKVL